MEEIKIYQQIDWNGFHIGTNADLVPGAIDTMEPVFDKNTENAKWNGTEWIIKTIEQWEHEEKERLELQKIEYEKQLIIQKEIDKAKKITDFYEMASSLGLI